MNRMNRRLMGVFLCGGLLTLVGCGGGDDNDTDPVDPATNAPVDTVSSATRHQKQVVWAWAATLMAPGGSSSEQGTVVFNADQTYSVSSPIWSSNGAYTGSGSTVTLFGIDSNGRSGTVVMQINGPTMTITSHYEGITGTLTKR